jgi:hypothetical protein
MASTRNKNRMGDYIGEIHINHNIGDYRVNHKYFGRPEVTCFPGDGLLPGNVYSENLSKNNVDIESELFGIGTTNLVNPKPTVQADINQLKSLSIIDRPTSILIPEPLAVEGGQRPNILS